MSLTTTLNPLTTAVEGADHQAQADAGPQPNLATDGPNMAEVAGKSSLADELDLVEHLERANSVSDDEVKKVKAAAAAARSAFSAVAKHDRSCRAARAKAHGTALPLVQALCQQPEILCALAVRSGIMITARTSPTLVAIKALFPDLDRREQSDTAQLHNHAMACGWTGEDLEREIKATGIVELIKRERQRQRLRMGAGEAPATEATVEGLLPDQRGFRVSQICTPNAIQEGRLGLLVFGVVKGEVRVFDVDDSEKRVIAAVRHCVKRGCVLKTRAGGSDQAMVEEGGDGE